MKDLVLKAVKAFPVWPEGATHIVNTRPDWDGNSELQDTFEPSYDGRDKNGSNFLFGREAWQIACTREQHIRKRVELIDSFSTIVGVSVTPEELAYIVEIDSKNNTLDDVTDTDVGEWVPEVGQECEYSYDFFFKDRCNGLCTVIAYYCGDVWIELSVDKTRHVVKADKIEFRPLKTEAEKERERLYQELYDMETGMDDYHINRVIEFIQGREHEQK